MECVEPAAKRKTRECQTRNGRKPIGYIVDELSNMGWERRVEKWGSQTVLFRTNENWKTWSRGVKG